jgi:hypothetical protein
MVDGSGDRDGSARDNPETSSRSIPLASDAGSATSRGDAGIRSDAQGTGRRWVAAVAILVLAGASLVLLSSAKYGAGMSPDSVKYFEVARSLVSGKGFVFRTGAQLLWWPPLYPMLLALVGFVTRLDPAAFAHVVNAVLFALVICLSAHLFQASFRQTTYCLLGVCAVLFSVPLSDVYAMALSESLFVPLVLIYLASAQRYWNSGGVGTLAVMAISTGLALVTTGQGVPIILAGVLTIVLASGSTLGTRVRRACAFAGLSLVPEGLWLVYNPRVVGAVLREKPGSADPHATLSFLFAGNLKACVGTILSWYSPGTGIWLIVLTGAAVVAIASSRAVRGKLAGSVRSLLLHNSPSVLLCVTYILGLVSMVSLKHVPFVPTRYLSSLYVPVTLILLELVARLFRPTQLSTAGVARKVPAILLALWLCFPLASVVRSAVGCFKNGAGGYNTKEWRESGTVAYVKKTLSVNDDVHVYSNGTEALWELASVSGTQTPRRTAGNLSDLEGRWPAENGSVLVWFENITRPYLFSAEELGEVADVVEVAHLDDGSIFRVSVRQTEVRDSSPTGGASPSSP